MAATNSLYRFRVQVEDLPSIDFLLHILIQHDQLPQYFDLLNKIKEHSKTVKLDIDNYYIMIKRDNIYKFKFMDDSGLQNAFNSITERDRLEIKLMRTNGTEPYSDTLLKPVLKPIFIRRASQITDDSLDTNDSRKESGDCFDLDLLRYSSFKEIKQLDKKLPTLSNIITEKPVQWAPARSPYYNSPETPNQIKLPSVSSLFLGSPSSPTTQKYYPFSSTAPLSPPLSAISDSTSCQKSKRVRGGSVPHQSQFVCDHVDTSTGKVCSQAFRRSYDLSRHQMIHLKNRPFCYCHTCGKKFTRLDALRRHERIQGHNK